MPRNRIAKIISTIFLIALVFSILCLTAAHGEVSAPQPRLLNDKETHALILKMKQGIARSKLAIATYNATSTTSTTKAKYYPPRVKAAAVVVVQGSVDYHYLEPCITGFESGGGVIGRKDYTAHNPHSTASGEAQWLDSTWNGYGGFARAMFAPPAIQDQRFVEDLTKGISYIRQTWAAQRSNCHF